jgi:hypothetical protein
MKHSKKHPATLLSIFYHRRVKARELISGNIVEFEFWQIDWSTEGIEDGGISVCHGAQKTNIIVDYNSMELKDS